MYHGPKGVGMATLACLDSNHNSGKPPFYWDGKLLDAKA